MVVALPDHPRQTFSDIHVAKVEAPYNHQLRPGLQSQSMLSQAKALLLVLLLVLLLARCGCYAAVGLEVNDQPSSGLFWIPFEASQVGLIQFVVLLFRGKGIG